MVVFRPAPQNNREGHSDYNRGRDYGPSSRGSYRGGSGGGYRQSPHSYTSRHGGGMGPSSHGYNSQPPSQYFTSNNRASYNNDYRSRGNYPPGKLPSLFGCFTPVRTNQIGQTISLCCLNNDLNVASNCAAFPVVFKWSIWYLGVSSLRFPTGYWWSNLYWLQVYAAQREGYSRARAIITIIRFAIINTPTRVYLLVAHPPYQPQAPPYHAAPQVSQDIFVKGVSVVFVRASINYHIWCRQCMKSS